MLSRFADARGAMAIALTVLVILSLAYVWVRGRRRSSEHSAPAMFDIVDRSSDDDSWNNGDKQ